MKRTFNRRCSAPRLCHVLMGGAMLVGVAYQAYAQQQEDRMGLRVLGTRPPDQPPVIGQPLETRPPLGEGQKPAFAGQTRAGAVATKTPLQIDVIAHGLSFPWSLAFISSDQILVTEKTGTMRVVTRDGKIGDPIDGVPTVVYGLDAGLFDVVLDPAFSKNRLIYITYVEQRDEGNGVCVAKAVLREDLKRLDNFSVILRVGPSVNHKAHYGSRLLFDKEGKLFVSLSERMFEPTRMQSQNLDSRMGKILRINTDGSAAAGNPFFYTAGALPDIWAYGVRDPQGLTFNPVNGELWETEHGPQAGDEVNVIEPGKNYGWPVTAYGTEYDGRLISGGMTAKAGMEQPVYYWDPAVAPSGATFYSADLIPEWRNNLFVAALAGQHLIRLVLDGRHVIGEERLLLEQHQRIRDVIQGPDGALWVVTDDKDGRLIRIGRQNR